MWSQADAYPWAVEQVAGAAPVGLASPDTLNRCM